MPTVLKRAGRMGVMMSHLHLVSSLNSCVTNAMAAAFVLQSKEVHYNPFRSNPSVLRRVTTQNGSHVCSDRDSMEKTMLNSNNNMQLVI